MRWATPILSRYCFSGVYPWLAGIFWNRYVLHFVFSSRRRHTRFDCDWSSDVCSSDLVLDINPRVWGWHTLCARAGVDFSYLLWLLARGEPVPCVRGRAGERWIHTSADLRVALGGILSGDFSFGSYLRSLRGPLESAILSWDDPAPALLDLPLFAYSLGKYAWRGKILSPVGQQFRDRKSVV